MSDYRGHPLPHCPECEGPLHVDSFNGMPYCTNSRELCKSAGHYLTQDQIRSYLEYQAERVEPEPIGPAGLLARMFARDMGR